MAAAFGIALRGYDIKAVDRLLDEVEAAIAADRPETRAAARAALGRADFRRRLRGYDRTQVDRLIDDLIGELS